MSNEEKISRKKFLKSMTYAGGTLFSAGLGAYFIFKNPAVSDELYAGLKDKISGVIIKDIIEHERYCYDFSRTIRKEPRIIIEPRDDNDIIITLKAANEAGVPVSIRGAGHSCFGQTLSDGGILLAINNPEPDYSVGPNSFVTASAGTNWLQLEQKINPQGLTAPVITDYLEMTVGGTLSVGGYGLRSFEYGGQHDMVNELELVLPDGKRARCSETENSDLFRHSLCGLGQLGIITRARFQAVRYRPFTLVHYFRSETVKSFTGLLRSIFETDMIKLIDHFSAYWDGKHFISEIGFSREDITSLRKDASSLKNIPAAPAMEKRVIRDYHMYIHQSRKSWVERFGTAHHLWEDYIFNFDALEKFLAETFTQKNIREFADFVPAVYMLVIRNKRKDYFPFSSSCGSAKMLCGAGFYCMVRNGDAEGLKRSSDFLKKNMERCIRLGGRPYLYGWHGLSAEEFVKIYGDHIGRMTKLKKKYDRNSILSPGVLLHV
jgi:FAD/FMN-containing dehydrogenase